MIVADIWSVIGSIAGVVSAIGVAVAVVIYWKQRSDHDVELQRGRHAMLDALRTELDSLRIEHYAELSGKSFDSVSLVVPRQLFAASILDYTTDGVLIAKLIELERCVESYNSLILTATSHILLAAVLEQSGMQAIPPREVIADLEERAEKRAKAIYDAKDSVRNLLPDPNITYLSYIK